MGSVTRVDPYAVSDLDVVLRGQGFLPSDPMLWAALYPLSVPLSTGIRLAHDSADGSFRIVFVEGTTGYPAISERLVVDREFTGSHVLVMVTVPSGWGRSHVDDARARVQLLAGALNIALGGIRAPALKSPVWEGAAKPSPPDRMTMFAADSVPSYGSPYNSNDLQFARTEVERIHTNAPERVHLALRWFHKGLREGEHVDALLAFWLVTTALAEGWWHTLGHPGDDAVGHIKKYLNQPALGISREDRRSLFAQAKATYAVRKQVVHESRLAVTEAEVVQARDLAGRILLAELNVL